MLDGDVILPADGATIGERRRISVNGVISVAIAVDKNGRVFGQPDVRIQGIPVEDDRDEFLSDAREAAADAAGLEKNAERRREAVRLAVRRVATEWTGKKPIIDVLVVEGF